MVFMAIQFLLVVSDDEKQTVGLMGGGWAVVGSQDRMRLGLECFLRKHNLMFKKSVLLTPNNIFSIRSDQLFPFPVKCD